MNTFFSFAVAILVYILPNTGAFGQNFYDHDCNHEVVSVDTIIETILLDYPSCVENYSEDKVHLNIDHIELTKKGPTLKYK